MTAAASRRFGLQLLLLLPALLWGAERGVGADGASLDLPYPNLEQLEEGIAERLRVKRAELDDLLADTQVPVDELAAAIGSLGGLYYLYDYLDLAAVCFTEAERLQPAEFRWPYLKAVALRLDGQPEAAEEALGRALELRPRDAAALVRLGDVQLETGRVDDAERSYRSALAIDEARPAAHYGLGRVAVARGDPAAGIASFERALALQPAATAINYQIGMAYRALGDVEAARGYLVKNSAGRVRVVDPILESLAADLTTTNRIFNAGIRAMRAAEFEDAVRLFTLAREERPDDHLVEYNLALALLKTGDRAGGLAALEASLEKNPDFRNGHFNLASLLAEDGRVAEAAHHFGRAHEIDPEDQAAHLEWATALALAGDRARAAAELEKLLARAPQLTTARLRLAQLQLQAGSGPAARQSFERVLAGDAADGELAAAHLGLGRLADGRGDAVAAVEHYRRAARRGAQAEAGLALGSALGRLGRFAEAADAFSAVIETDPGRLEPHFARAMALVLGEIYPRARTSLEASLQQHPQSLPLRHLYSRLLAASPDAMVRDGERALEIATEVFGREQTLEHAETVAMALAETGRFDQAVEWQRKVVAEAERSARPRAIAAARQRLDLYERGEPCRAPWKSG